MKTRIAAPLLIAAFAAPAFAVDYTDEAEVIATVPIYQTVNEPRQQCWMEPVTTYEQPQRSGGGAIIGAITGGLVGSTVGRGNGRVGAAAVGAAVGAVVGDRIDNQGNYAVPVTRDVQRCQTVNNVRQVISGYQVTYRYNGRDTTVILPQDPGPRVRIGVGISGRSGVEVIPAVAVAAATPVVENIAYVQRETVPVWHHRPYYYPRPSLNIVLHGNRHGHHPSHHGHHWNRGRGHDGGHFDRHDRRGRDGRGRGNGHRD